MDVAWNVLFSSDFNCDTDFASPVASDINADGAITALAPFEDWTNLVYDGGLVGLGAPALPDRTVMDEPSTAELLAARDGIEALLAAKPTPTATPAPSATSTPTPQTGSGPPRPPALAGLTLRPARFAASRRARGTRVSYRLSEAGRVRFRIERELPGRRRGGSLRPAAPGPARARLHAAGARRRELRTQPGGPGSTRSASALAWAGGRCVRGATCSSPRRSRPTAAPARRPARGSGSGAELGAARLPELMPGLIERYRERLPFAPEDPVVSLGEGSTPHVLAERLSERTGAEVWLKIEGANPTGSFKDRGMTCAVSAAVREGAEALVCASTGNTAASAAAYAARGGLAGVVIVPEGKIATGKLAQALMHGARVIALRGNFDQALTLVRELAKRRPIALVNSVNPFRLEGQKTAAFEILDELGEIDALCIPVGNAGNVTAYWKGFQERGSRPRMLGYQAAGAAPLVHGAPVESPETVASAIRIGNPARWEEALDAFTSSRGQVRAVSDEQILDAYRFLAREEGVFCEPASAAGVAGLLANGAEGAERIACVLTGHGLKDPQTALAHAGSVVPCEPDIEAVERAIDA